MNIFMFYYFCILLIKFLTSCLQETSIISTGLIVIKGTRIINMLHNIYFANFHRILWSFSIIRFNAKFWKIWGFFSVIFLHLTFTDILGLNWFDMIILRNIMKLWQKRQDQEIISIRKFSFFLIFLMNDSLCAVKSSLNTHISNWDETHSYAELFLIFFYRIMLFSYFCVNKAVWLVQYIIDGMISSFRVMRLSLYNALLKIMKSC